MLALRQTSNFIAEIAVTSSSTLGCTVSALQIGHSIQVKVIAGPGQRRLTKDWMQSAW
eukprot:SAG31_NODE_11461_length_1027_cov_1.564655_3_plen_57_part_01